MTKATTMILRTTICTLLLSATCFGGKVVIDTTDAEVQRGTPALATYTVGQTIYIPEGYNSLKSIEFWTTAARFPLSNHKGKGEAAYDVFVTEWNGNDQTSGQALFQTDFAVQESYGLGDDPVLKRIKVNLKNTPVEAGNEYAVIWTNNGMPELEIAPIEFQESFDDYTDGSLIEYRGFIDDPEDLIDLGFVASRSWDLTMQVRMGATGPKAVPEPSSIVLLLIGLVALVRRRK